MIDLLFLEKHLEGNPYALKIQRAFSHVTRRLIDRYEPIFNGVKRPYSTKQEGQRLIIAEKRGRLVKPAPEGYGVLEGKHYYFVHAYNCVYDCDYCYLRGYFSSPDLVFFVNHRDIIKAMQVVANKYLPDVVWFHHGEFSDSLALSHITQELPLYWDFFKRNPHAFLELRTKSSNVQALEPLEPLHNVVISYSLSPQEAIRTWDKKTPSLHARLKAMEWVASKGFRLGMHLDPIMFTEGCLLAYDNLIKKITSQIPQKQLSYVSLGVVRFPKKVYRAIRLQGGTTVLEGLFGMSHKKVRLSMPKRYRALHAIREQLITHGIDEQKIYLCMEDNSSIDSYG